MSAAAARSATAPFLPMVTKQSWAEFIKLFRVPAFSTTSIVLPAMFYAFIGLGQAKQLMGPPGSVTFGEYFLASMALYGVANVMVLGFGISLANERGQKQDLLMQATPLPPIVFFIAKTISALVIAFMALVVLSLLAYTAGGAHLSSSQWLTLFFRSMLCSIPFVGLGFGLGYIAGPNSAPAVTNLIYLPTAFASGLFFPLNMLPQLLRNIAPYLPLYRGAQLVWDSVGAPTEGGSITTDWLWMGGYTVAFFMLAIWAYRRDQGRKFN
ncbi:MAG TPA: ABC transporter permease [Candidatus Dormibacteraeota bacterium]|nr:ABC transporter permease [Candidatus Dormibacteraeota bacterium]